MKHQQNTYSKLLDEFFSANREKSLRFLQYKFTALSSQDIEDVYQDAALVLYTKIANGELSSLDCSLYTYFLSICINQSHKQLSSYIKRIDTQIDVINDFCLNKIQEDKLSELESLVFSPQEDKDEHEFINWIEQQVRECVKEMKPPCNHILQGFYWEGFSHKTLAELYGMKNEDVCKTQANRCRNKFKEYIRKLVANYGQ